MKKILALILALVMVLTLSAAAAATYEGLYAKSTVVVEVNEDDDIVVVEDFNGFLWKFEGCEDWVVGDICAMVMDNNGTPETIFDDIILNTTYCGWVK